MLDAIYSILVALQLSDVIVSILTKKTKRTVYFSFFVWHLSLIVGVINGISIWISLLQVLNCAFIFSNFRKVKVVTIIGIGDEIKDTSDLYLAGIERILGDSISNQSGETLKVFKLTLLEKKFFGLTKETKEMEIPVKLREEDVISFRKQIIGHTFDVVI
jgi:hypothetical protein